MDSADLCWVVSYTRTLRGFPDERNALYRCVIYVMYIIIIVYVRLIHMLSLNLYLSGQ